MKLKSDPAPLVIGLTAILFALYMVSSWLIPIFMGIVFAILFYPIKSPLKKRHLSDPTSAGIITFGMTVAVIAPFFTFVVLGAKNALIQVQALRAANALTVDPGRLRRLFNSAAKLLGTTPEGLTAQIHDLTIDGGIKIADALAKLIGMVPSASVGLIITLITAFYFLQEGSRIRDWVKNHSVFSGQETESLLHHFVAISRSVMLASVVSGFIQSLFFTIVYLIVGGANPALVGFLIFMFSFVPLVGAFPITIGAAMIPLIDGQTGVGVALLVAAAILGLLDNVIRPLVLRGGAGLHPLLAFIGVFGGISTVGFMGVFIGPIVVGTGMHFFKILAESYVSTKNHDE